MGGIGVLLVSLWLVHLINYRRALTPQELPTSTSSAYLVTTPLFIRSEGTISVALEPASISDGVWTVSENAANYLTQASMPGEGGNVVIYGHNKREILGNLTAVSLGDTIEVVMSDGGLHAYEVIEKMTVANDDVEWLMPTESEVLTVYTCTGWLETKRLIIRGVPIQIEQLGGYNTINF